MLPRAVMCGFCAVVLEVRGDQMIGRLLQADVLLVGWDTDNYMVGSVVRGPFAITGRQFIWLDGFERTIAVAEPFDLMNITKLMLHAPSWTLRLHDEPVLTTVVDHDTDLEYLS